MVTRSFIRNSIRAPRYRRRSACSCRGVGAATVALMLALIALIALFAPTRFVVTKQFGGGIYLRRDKFASLSTSFNKTARVSVRVQRSSLAPLSLVDVELNQLMAPHATVADVVTPLFAAIIEGETERGALRSIYERAIISPVMSCAQAW